MKAQVDGDQVFVSNDDFTNLQESQVVFGNVREFCIAAALAMVTQGFNRYDAIIDDKDWNPTFPFGFKDGGRVLSVTIDWVESPKDKLS